MKEAGQRFDSTAFYPQVADAMNDGAGRMQALPLGLSLPVLFWNKAEYMFVQLDEMTFIDTRGGGITRVRVGACVGHGGRG